MKIIFILGLATTLLSAPSGLSQTAPPEPAAPTAKVPAAKNVDENEAEKLLREKKDLVVLDIRTPKEFSSGRISGAKNLNFYDRDFRQKLQALDRNQPYLLHCAVGGRSAKALELMKELQFKEVYHLESGMKGWEKAGKAVQK
jgi:phage shock protein E